MNRRIRRLGIVFALLFVMLFVQLNRVQFFGAERLQEDVNNTRGLIREFGRPRGPIISADGVLLARSLPYDGSVDFVRDYPEGDLYAHIVGYQSLNVAATGLERAYNDELAGVPVEQQFLSFGDLFADRDTTATIRLSIRHDVQEAARSALGAQLGSVVALDPRTGEIIAMWTYPSFDPNVLADPDGFAANAAFAELRADPNDPLLAKAYREIFFPGSTFKLVTAAAGMESGLIDATEPVFGERDSYEPIPAGASIGNFGGSTCGGDLVEILRVSCNTAFAEMGAEWVGSAGMIETAEAFGFNTTLNIDLPSSALSRFPTEYGERLADVDFYRGSDGNEAAGSLLPNGSVSIHEDSARLAQTAIGQNDVAATPLQMALVAAAIANEGKVMTPHVVVELEAADGSTYEEIEPEISRIAMRPSTAATLAEAMRVVANEGTARNLLIEGLDIGGKTGTAQLGTDPPNSHAWIVGFAGLPGEEPSLAFAVIVEAQEGASEQTGGRVAAPIARAVIEVVFGAS
ncbi:MAG: penicillin-binding transpeptidase domain-containing protein [Acidimicrobiales bacterium]|nr:penicillin-binding transpeptidase domain-containing protein [Acidimicrobiales bacterium]